MNSNRDRLKFLRVRVNQLAAEIEQAGKQQEYLRYLEQLRALIVPPESVTEDDFDVMLPEERAEALLAHYHTMRTELLQMVRELEQPGTLTKINAWLEAPLIQGGLAAATLVEAAHVLYEILKISGVFLRVPTTDIEDRGL